MSNFNYTYRKFKSGAMSAVAIFCAVLVISPLVLILIHLLRQGVTSLNWAFLTELPKPVGEAG
ncbi:MAG TPA: hypothetical protein VKC60_04645, partial [Opitutaceae bacterium]|nr:hypothetical protein [Opitutaceae bacterium]